MAKVFLIVKKKIQIFEFLTKKENVIINLDKIVIVRTL